MSVGILVEVLISSSVIVDELIGVAGRNGRVAAGLRSEYLRLSLRDIAIGLIVVTHCLRSQI